MKKLFSVILILLVLILAKKAITKEQIVCPADVKVCDDGSYINRTGKNCEFKECPSQSLPDYEALKEACKEKQSVSCCLASVLAMQEGGYMLDEGKTFETSTCPQGYKPNMMRCVDSYRWCQKKEQ